MADKVKPEEDLEEKTVALTEARINEMLTAALTSRDKKMEKRFSDLLAPLVEKFSAEKVEKVESTSSDKEDPKYQALLKKLESMEKQVKEKQESSDKLARSVREKEGFSQFKSLLNGKVRPDAVESVAKLLFHADKKVSIDDDGKLSWNDGDAQIDVDSGIKSYLKSKEASIFLPAPVAKQAQSKPSNNGLVSKIINEDSGKKLEYKQVNASEASSLLAKFGLSPNS